MSDIHTGDSGAVPDPVSVPSGDSVTLIERLTDPVLMAWPGENKRVREAAAARLAVLELRESADKIEETGESASLIEVLRRVQRVLRWSNCSATVCVTAASTEVDVALARAELRESDRQSSESRGLESASALEVEAGSLPSSLRTPEQMQWIQDRYKIDGLERLARSTPDYYEQRSPSPDPSRPVSTDEEEGE